MDEETKVNSDERNSVTVIRPVGKITVKSSLVNENKPSWTTNQSSDEKENDELNAEGEPKNLKSKIVMRKVSISNSSMGDNVVDDSDNANDKSTVNGTPEDRADTFR